MCVFSRDGRCALTGVECDAGEAAADCPFWALIDQLYEIANALRELKGWVR